MLHAQQHALEHRTLVAARLHKQADLRAPVIENGRYMAMLHSRYDSLQHAPVTTKLPYVIGPRRVRLVYANTSHPHCHPPQHTSLP